MESGLGTQEGGKTSRKVVRTSAAEDLGGNHEPATTQGRRLCCEPVCLSDLTLTQTSLDLTPLPGWNGHECPVIAKGLC